MKEIDWAEIITKALNDGDLEAAEILIEEECNDLFPDECDFHIEMPPDPPTASEVFDTLFDPREITCEWEEEDDEQSSDS